MRTTIVLDDDLSNKLKNLAPPKKLSLFINQCLRGHFNELEAKQREKTLEEAYARISKKNSKEIKSLEILDMEEWPEW